jgi:tRNA-2-methylthio-N6-dimethylallyladenosine synthase
MKRFFLENYGCQMNVYDTEGMERLLIETGYVRTGSPEDADVLLVNTCSVREHAEERALNRLSELTRIKDRRPEVVVGVTGCMAQRMGADIRKRLPRIDLVVGSQALPAVLEGIDEAEKARGRGGKQKTYLAPKTLEHYLPPPSARGGEPRLKGFVTIIRGCNKSCAYCIVPTTRGPEVSRTPAEIVAEVEELVAAGTVEVMLLGQNVNSYEAQGVDFPELLHRVGAVGGLRRLRFTTSHPRDMNRDVVARMGTAKRLQPWLHLPVQSGSTKVLAEMNRDYSLEHYLDVVEAAREAIEDLSLTTDIIVGFPGETEEDFEATLRLLEQVRYDTLYGFKYSPRSGTSAASREDAISGEEKQRRLAALLELQKRISNERNQRFVGRTLEVMLEGRDPKRGNWLGKSGHNKTVVLPEAPYAVGDFVDARIDRAEGLTLYGTALGRAAE